MSRVLILILAGLVFVLAGCSSVQPGGGDTPEGPIITSDRDISDEVYRRIRYDMPDLGMQFGVSAQDGVVTLQGVVEEQAMSARAIGVARDTPGVKEVIDRTTRF